MKVRQRDDNKATAEQKRQDRVRPERDLFPRFSLWKTRSDGCSDPIHYQFLPVSPLLQNFQILNLLIVNNFALQVS